MRLRQAIRLTGVGAILAAAPTQAHAEYYTPFQEFSSTDNAQHVVPVQCEAGDVAIGGGVSVPGATYLDGVYLNSSRPDPGTNAVSADWKVTTDNYIGGDPANDARAYAVCDSKGRPSDYKLRSAVVSVSDGTQFGTTVECEPGEVAVGGGGAIDGIYVDETYQLNNVPWDGPDGDRDPDDGWQIEQNNDEGGLGSNQLRVYVVCDKKSKTSDFDWVKEKDRVKDGELKTVAAKCGKRPIVGGGVSGSALYEHGLYIGASFPRRLSLGKTAWTASVHNYETLDDETRKITAWAICKR